MTKLTLKVLSALAVITILSISTGVMAASKDEAKATAKKVEIYFKTNGKDKTVVEVQKNNGMFEKGEVYVFIFDTNGTWIADPKLPGWVGKYYKSLKDADGKYFIKEAIEALKTKNEVWIDYKCNNPATKKIGLKNAYFLKVGNMIISSGVWN